MTPVQASKQRLTPKGLATRERIVEAAAQLIYEHGLQNTNNELIRKAAGVSGSQLSRHFPTKEGLIKAVIDWRTDSMITSHGAALGQVGSLAALRRWADSFIAREELDSKGCPFGSLVGEIVKTNIDLRGSLVQGFEEWRALFRSALQTMCDSGELNAKAEPDQLAYALTAAFQGGMLLDQTVGNAEPLRAALNSTLAYIETFASGKPGTSARPRS